MEEVKSFRAGTGLSDQSAFNPFAFRISGRYRHAAVCLCSANATLDETGKKAIMTKEKTAEDGQPEPEAEKPKEKTKKAKPEETASQALDTSALLKKKEKRNHSV